jgi:hypothetical protein
MRKTKLVWTFALMALLLSGVGLGAVTAQEPVSQDVGSLDLPGLHDPVSEWTNADLRQLIELAVDERITVPEARDVWRQLTEEQREKTGELLAIKTGILLGEWQQFVESNKTTLRGFTPLGFPGEIWREPIENIWTWGQPPGTTFASSYWNSPSCDDDPSDPDWAFWFNRSYEWYSRNPSGLRWTSSDSAQVYLAFMAAYNGNLNGYSFNWKEARLCIGTTAVSVAGGPDNVKNNVFLSPNH